MDFLRKFGWGLLGVALVLAGCILMWHRGGEGGGLYYLLLVLIGLAMISPEATKTIIAAVRSVLHPEGEKGSDSGNGAQGNELVSTIEERAERNRSVLGVNKEPPQPDEWYRVLRPVLHQASYYTVPTYYLNTNLHFLDWNIAFELIFSEILEKIRDRHVNYFIAALENCDAVFSHAHDFTENVARGQLPLVDTEPLIYRSPRYGRVVFLKVATQLHDARGELHGWAIALMIQEIDWGPFERDLREQLRLDKLWGLYSSSYDRILPDFPPYRQLIKDVIEVIPGGGRSVADLGAGTGNVTAALLEAGHRVTAVENNIFMLDRLRAKDLDMSRVAIVKTSVEHLGGLREASFDAVAMVNVLYAVQDPLECLRGVARILKPGGVLGLSTTHKGTRLDNLLNTIRHHLETAGKLPALWEDYERLRECNEEIERTIACGHSVEDYRGYVETAGFTITKSVPSTYLDAVMLLHAKKIDRADT